MNIPGQDTDTHAIINTGHDQKIKFTCNFPSCNASYRRKEHLRRHEAAQHTRPQEFLCALCDRKFGRNDTLRRHVRQDHKEEEPLHRARQACGHCRVKKSRCEGGPPCNRCLRHRIQCSFNNQGHIIEDEVPDSSMDTGLAGVKLQRTSSLQQTSLHNKSYCEKQQAYIDLYFNLFHPHWSFVHKGSFNVRHETPLLVNSMAVIGMWASEKQSARSAAVELHEKLNLAIRQQKEKWDISKEEAVPSASFLPIPTFQAILLHIIFSLLYNNRGFVSLDLKLHLPPIDFELLDSLIQSCERLRMFDYPSILARYQHATSSSYTWVCIEEVKRFYLALYEVCRGLSTSSPGTHNVARAVESLLSEGQLKLPMPENDPLWNAMTNEEWNDAIRDEATKGIDTRRLRER